MSEENTPWTGSRSGRESSSAPNARTPGARNPSDASASHEPTWDSSGSATTADGPEVPALHPKHIEWIESRGISADLARKLGLHSVVRSFLDETAEEETYVNAHAIAIPYFDRGRIVNRKYRRVGVKQNTKDKGGKLILWNHDCLIEDSSEPLVICEGEWDAMVALGLGWRAVSVPNGTPEKSAEDPATAHRYEYLWHARDLINRVPKVILATDDDAPGKALRNDLIALIGADRCAFVDYPFPTKDLNEVLLEYGPDAVHKALREAKPVPVKGLYRIRDFPDPGPVATIPLGVPVLDEMLPIVPGTLTVLTGYAGQGKTSLTMAIAGHQLRYNIPVTLGTFETMPRPVLERRLRATILGVAESALANLPPDQLAEADACMADNLTIIAQMVGEDEEMDLTAVLDLARVAVQRDGCKLLILDPWNEIEHKRRRDESETEYANRAIRAIKHFMRELNVAVWIVAHPAKPEGGNTKLGTPGLYSISGSAAWANKADYGVVYTRPDKEKNLAKVHVTKVRMGLPGREGTAELEFDWRISGFRPAPGQFQAKDPTP